MILETYFSALQKFEDTIPKDYNLRKQLLEKINYIREKLLYKSPEIISMVYSNLCTSLIEDLPSKENITKPKDMWASEAWKFITESAIKANKIIGI
tara:strand:- start:220 stop:507 length:288 start_codon:yes stop_codon:yes gene_type:complete